MPRARSRGEAGRHVNCKPGLEVMPFGNSPPNVAGVAGNRPPRTAALEVVAFVRSDFGLALVARVLPGLTSLGLRTSRSKSSLPPARLRTDAGRAGPSRPIPGNASAMAAGWPRSDGRGGDVLWADWEGPDRHQDEIALQEGSGSSTIAKRFGFQAGSNRAIRAG